MKWTFEHIPEQRGRVAIVTGANTGIGLETARLLAQKGAEVVLACRSADKGQAAIAELERSTPSLVGTVRLELLDLSDLDSVADFAHRITARYPRLDLLINNAGVMVPPLAQTKQGFELQFGTNHLGHFALTGRLLPLLLATPNARVVVVSSTAQAFGRIAFDDLDWQKRSYSPFRAYGQSKLANSLFALELQRRLDAAGLPLRVTSAHPGWTATDLQRNVGIARFFNPYLAMKPVDGAMPTLRAACDPDAAGGSYWGPTGFAELVGPPGPARIGKSAKDTAVAARLFAESEKRTGVTFDLAARASDAAAQR